METIERSTPGTGFTICVDSRIDKKTVRFKLVQDMSRVESLGDSQEIFQLMRLVVIIAEKEIEYRYLNSVLGSDFAVIGNRSIVHSM